MTAVALVLAGCGAGSRPAAKPAAAAHPAPVLRCGAAGATGRALSVPARTLPLPGSPDGIAVAPGARTAYAAIQSGAPRVAVLAPGPRVAAVIAVPGAPSGMRVTPDEHMVLAAVRDGVVIITGRRVRGVLSVPPAVAGSGPGAAEIAVSPDSRYAFVTLEGAGRVAVFALGPRRYVGSIVVGAGALGIAASPDGRWLYEVSEAGAPHHRGRLSVIDLVRAQRDPGHALVASVVVGCAPVRVAVSPDGATVWVTARDADALLGFGAASLRRGRARAPASVTQVGAAPLGLSVVAQGRRVLVADSRSSCLSVVDTVQRPPRNLGCVRAGDQPDAIAATSRVALLTVSGARALQQIALRRLP